jgi:hypothetical protein
LDQLERHVALRAPEPDPVAAEAERWCAQALDCTLADLDVDDLARVEQLLLEAPDFAHPLLLRACLARPGDREPPDGEACLVWTRRRWGYLMAADDPEAQALCQQLEAWAAAPGRPYLRGADLRLVLARLGVEWANMNFLELRRLVDLASDLKYTEALCRSATSSPRISVAKTIAPSRSRVPSRQ